MFDTLSEALVSLCIQVVNLLPNSPFLFLDTIQGPSMKIMGMVNWFIDFRTMLGITVSWVACIFVWYAYQIVLRWIKVIE